MKAKTVKKLVRIRGRLKDRASAAYVRRKANLVRVQQELAEAVQSVMAAGAGESFEVTELERRAEVVRQRSLRVQAARERVELTQQELHRVTMEERRAERVQDNFLEERRKEVNRLEARENDERSATISVANARQGGA